MNPYDPPTVSHTDAQARVRWGRYWLILNALLLAVPISIALFVSLSTRVQLSMQQDTLQQGPVIYQSEFVISGSLGPILAFFAIPNLIYLVVMAKVRIQTNRQST